MSEYFEVFCIIGFTFLLMYGIIPLILSIWALICVKSLEKSTHNVEYIPIDPKWASTDDQIKEINERNEEDLPDLDDDEEIPNKIDLNKVI